MRRRTGISLKNGDVFAGEDNESAQSKQGCSFRRGYRGRGGDGRNASVAAEAYWQGGAGNLDVSAKKGKLTYR